MCNEANSSFFVFFLYTAHNSGGHTDIEVSTRLLKM